MFIMLLDVILAVTDPTNACNCILILDYQSPREVRGKSKDIDRDKAKSHFFVETSAWQDRDGVLSRGELACGEVSDDDDTSPANNF